VLAMYLIGLREGLEATLVVSILVAYLVKTGRRDRLRPLFMGVAAAVTLSLVVGAGLTFGSSQLSFQAQEGFGGTMSFIAVALVTWMIFWMAKAARSIKSELEGRLDKALTMGTAALVVTAFVAVGREGLETALFVWPAVQAAGNTTQPLIGVLLGLISAVALGYFMYRGAVRFNIGKFFRYTGIVLILVAGGVLTYGIAEYQEIGWLGGQNSVAFDLTSAIPPDSFVAALLRGVFNIHPVTTWIQAVAWLAYVVPVMIVFLRGTRMPTRPGPAPAPVSESVRAA
jgi:high-affinity iron transporter